jgi:hypothetical protein
VDRLLAVSLSRIREMKTRMKRTTTMIGIVVSDIPSLEKNV